MSYVDAIPTEKKDIVQVVERVNGKRRPKKSAKYTFITKMHVENLLVFLVKS